MLPLVQYERNMTLAICPGSLCYRREGRSCVLPIGGHTSLDSTHRQDDMEESK